jgi:hypothetical protein
LRLGKNKKQEKGDDGEYSSGLSSDADQDIMNEMDKFRQEKKDKAKQEV